jgi:hypothetical protein
MYSAAIIVSTLGSDMQPLRSPPPVLTLRRRTTLSFHALGALGLVAATSVSLLVAAASGLAPGFQAGIVVVGVLTFLVLAMATKILAGRETLVYYHHEIAILAVTALICWATGRPVLAHLDATALGLGAFLVFGRVGCLCAGCCHGRPARGGCVYGEEHVRTGFPAHLAGRPLLPVQLIEASLVAGIVAVGLAMVGDPPGRAFAWYVTCYALVRFWLEGLRGDALRPFWRGLSAARWTSLAVVAVMTGLATAGALPGAREHVAALLILCAGAAWAASRAAPERWRPVDPRQVALLQRGDGVLLRASQGAPRVTDVGARVRLSAGRTEELLHFTLSRAGGALSDDDAASLAILIAERHGSAAVECLTGVAGTFHVVLRRPAVTSTRSAA